ncbi:MAG: DUF1013 domain-containing protein [Rhodobacteraceae bacterium]|nr:DUF1013 domain-containing protein [Paracoccaceae bacterium]
MAQPIMAKATAVWLVDNTTLSFRQIAEFCGLHELEVQGIADGEVAVGIKGFDPVANNQLERVEITRGEADAAYRLKLKYNPSAEGEAKRRGPRYTPLSKRQDRPAAIAWLVKFHPELTDAQISRLVGTTKPTIQTIRGRTHWNIGNIQPVDPVALGLCKQGELDAAVRKAAEKNAGSSAPQTDEEKVRLMSTEEALQSDAGPRLPTAIAGLESFSLSRSEQEEDEAPSRTPVDADSLFNLPAGDDEDEDEEEGQR